MLKHNQDITVTCLNCAVMLSTGDLGTGVEKMKKKNKKKKKL